MNLSNKNLFEINSILTEKLEEISENDILEFDVLNPDISYNAYNGETITIDNKIFMYRSINAWNDLSHALFCKMLTPIVKDKNFITIGYLKIDNTNSFHKSEENSEEKYGSTSIFSKINKNEEPSFLINYIQALKNVNINNRIRVLNLGVNEGSEFEVIKKYASNFENLELVGIDYCGSAINSAKEKFKDKNITFHEADINKLEALNLGTFDLIISIGTLQSTSLDFNIVFNNVVQKYLKKEGAMILGFPNCRWIDGNMIYGARVKNYSFSEMSLVFKDAIYCKKYLQQKKYRVTLTGKDYIFLTATSIRK